MMGPQPRLDNGAAGGALGIGLELLHLGQDDKVFKQVVDAHAGLGGDRADDGVTAPLLADQVILGQLLLDAVEVCLRVQATRMLESSILCKE